MKNESAVEEIKDRIDIVDFIGEYVNLKRAGQNYKGLCPFHKEKTPSFTVSPSKQIFYCFGCHKSGDILNFLMDFENLSFHEALVSLSEKAGISLEPNQGTKNLKDIYYNMNKCASEFFVESLSGSRKALEYLKGRSLSDEIIKQYKLGYSPPGSDALQKHLLTKGFTEEDIKRSGLIHLGKSQSYDFFRDRLMFPIIGTNGKVIAFGGRRLSEQKDIPKYINSPESPVFKKGESVFGLYNSKGSISQKGYAVVVEGYMDVLMCCQQGIMNVVAPLGTAITEAHLKRLKKLTNNLLLLFDGDNAGVSAAKRAVELASMLSINVKIAVLPPSEDPDSLLRKKGADALRDLFSRSISPVSFYFRLYGKNKVECVRRLLRLFLLNNDILQREELLRETAERSGMSELSLRQEIEILSKKGQQSDSLPSQKTDSLADLGSKTEEYFLRILLSCPSQLLKSVKSIDLKPFKDPTVKALVERIKSMPHLSKDRLFSELLNGSEGDQRAMLSRIMVEEPLEEEASREAMGDCLKKILLTSIEKAMEEATACGDIDLINRLLIEKRQLSIHEEGI